MLQLEPQNLLIKETFSLVLSKEYTPISLDRIITDFDFTTYKISTPTDKSIIVFSIGIKCWKDLLNYDVLELINQKYSKYSFIAIDDRAVADPGYDLSLILDLNAYRQAIDSVNADELVEELSLLKRNCFGSAFLKAFNRYQELAGSVNIDPNNIYGEEVTTNNEPVLKLDYRDYESIYIKPSHDRVTVIFSTIFSDEIDKVFSKVFLQEFSDARKRSIQKAPQVINSHNEVPLEIRHLVRDPENKDKVYITFVLFPRHLDTDEHKWNSITHIELFRSYFHYHIKIVKCYLHQRMRFRVNSFTKILNRARRDVDEEEMRAERKTASGRRFEMRT